MYLPYQLSEPEEAAISYLMSRVRPSKMEMQECQLWIQFLHFYLHFRKLNATLGSIKVHALYLSGQNFRLIVWEVVVCSIVLLSD